MEFQTIWHFDKFRNSKWWSVSSLRFIEYSRDQIMRRLVWGFAGRTYHIVGNLKSQLKF